MKIPFAVLLTFCVSILLVGCASSSSNSNVVNNDVAANSIPVAVSETPSVGWRYSVEEVGIDKDRTYFACVSSKEDSEFKATLCVVKGKTLARVAIVGYDKTTDCWSGCSIKVKFDDAPVMTVSAEELKGGESFVIAPFAKTVRRLADAKTFEVEAPLYSLRQVARFNVEGLDLSRLGMK